MLRRRILRSLTVTPLSTSSLRLFVALSLRLRGSLPISSHNNIDRLIVIILRQYIDELAIEHGRDRAGVRVLDKKAIVIPAALAEPVAVACHAHGRDDDQIKLGSDRRIVGRHEDAPRAPHQVTSRCKHRGLHDAKLAPLPGRSPSRCRDGRASVEQVIDQPINA